MYKYNQFGVRYVMCAMYTKYIEYNEYSHPGSAYHWQAIRLFNLCFQSVKFFPLNESVCNDQACLLDSLFKGV